MAHPPHADVLAASLAALNPAAGRLFAAQRERVALDEAAEAARRAAADESDDVYDPTADDLARQARWEAGEQPAADGDGGFDAGTYTEGVRLVAVLHKATLPPRDDVFDAARRGDLPLLRRLVEAGGHDINALDRFDASPLYYACLCGHAPVVRYLLEHGAVCESNSWDGERCFYVALTDAIRAQLRQFAAANRARGPLFALAFRAWNNPACWADVTFELPPPPAANDVGGGGGGGAPTRLHAHRALLAARSPYMRAQFAPGGRWADRSVVVLRDARLSSVALGAVLSFLYTERLLCPRSALRDVAAVARNLRLAPLAAFVARLVRNAADADAAAGGGGGGLGFGMVALDLGVPYVLGSVPEGLATDGGGEEEVGGEAAGESAISPAVTASTSREASVLALPVKARGGRDGAGGGDGSGAGGHSEPPSKAALLAAVSRAGLRRDVHRHIFMGGGGGGLPVVPPAAWELHVSLALAAQRDGGGGSARTPSGFGDLGGAWSSPQGGVVSEGPATTAVCDAAAVAAGAASDDSSGGDSAPPGGASTSSDDCSGGNSAPGGAGALAAAGRADTAGVLGATRPQPLSPPSGATSPPAASSDDEEAIIPLHDVELLVRGHVFRCHRLFLCGRSRFFESLLRFEEAKASDGGGAATVADRHHPLPRGDAHPASPPLAAAPADAPPRGGVTRLRCDELTPLTMALCLEWLYTDALRRVPVELLLEALHGADLLLLGDGLKPLLVGQAIEALCLDTLVDLLAAADLYNLHRLAGACAAFAARHLDAVLALPEFEALIVSNARGIVGRQAEDSVPMLDDIKTELAALLAGAGAGAPDASARRDELAARRAQLDAFAARLGLRCFSAEQARYRGVVHSGERGADAPAGSGGGVHGRVDEPLTSGLFRAIKGLGAR